MRTGLSEATGPIKVRLQFTVQVQDSINFVLTISPTGEIDLIEGVNAGPGSKGGNQITMHTGTGCTIDKAAAITGKLTEHLSCASSGADNSGCATLDDDPVSFGVAFNQAKGGVIGELRLVNTPGQRLLIRF